MEIVRDARQILLEQPPPGLWAQVQEELTAETEPEAGPGRAVHRPTQRRGARSRRGRRVRNLSALAAAAIVGLVGGVVITNVVNVDEPPKPPPAVAAASLTSPDEPSDARGTAEIVDVAGQRTLELDATGVEAATGYFKVWLLNSGGTQTYSLGVLPADWQGRFAVPGGLSLSRYPVVDVSVEEFDSDPTHSAVSVLRGALRGAAIS